MESREFEEQHEGFGTGPEEEAKLEGSGFGEKAAGGSKEIGSGEAAAPKERRWVWAFPLIEGVPPCPRGGHTATLAGQSLIIFGGHYYSGKEVGYAYLNDVHILDVNQNRWIVILFRFVSQ